MSFFTTWKIDDLLSDLKNNKISNNYMVAGEWSEFTLLQSVINSMHDKIDKISLLNEFIELGCNVDQYGSNGSTAISFAASNGDWDIVQLLLPYHEKGHRSDLNILESSAGSLNPLMFENVLSTNTVDTNTTQYKGSHILHHLAEIDGFAPYIKLLWKYNTDTIPNPIHRRGYSPLTKAINSNNINCVQELIKNENTMIIGYLSNPYLVIDLEIVNRYNLDNFWDLKPDLIEYACIKNKEYLLPNEVKNIFIF